MKFRMRMLLIGLGLLTVIGTSACIASSTSLGISQNSSAVGSKSTSTPKTTVIFYNVVRVVDGDTIVISKNKKDEKVRLIGVNTPETHHPTKGVEPYGPEAAAYTKKRLDGTNVRIVIGEEPRDKYKRLLAYVYLEDGTFFNEELVREGYAQVMTIPPNDKFSKTFIKRQREAREAKRGLWGLDPKEDQTKPLNVKAPLGKDRDCSDFKTHAEAQSFFETAGGPAKDPHHLDSDGDGNVCERLP